MKEVVYVALILLLAFAIYLISKCTTTAVVRPRTFVQAALDEFNKRERERADPFSCPRFRLEDLTIEEIEQIMARAKELRSRTL